MRRNTGAGVNAKSLITLIAQTLRDAGFLVATAKDESTGDQAAAPWGDDRLVNKKDLRESVRQGTQSVVRYLTVMRRKGGPAS